MCPDTSPQQKYVGYLPSYDQTNLHVHSSNEQMILAGCMCVYVWVGGVITILIW